MGETFPLLTRIMEASSAEHRKVDIFRQLTATRGNPKN